MTDFSLHYAGVASPVCSGANTIVSKLGALIVLESILGRPIDIDSIPMQDPLEGEVPGGSIDLAALGINPARFMNRLNQQPARGTMQAEEEMNEDERVERELVLAELMGM